MGPVGDRRGPMPVVWARMKVEGRRAIPREERRWRSGPVSGGPGSAVFRSADDGSGELGA